MLLFRQCADNSGPVEPITKRCIAWFLPWAAVFVVSCALAYAIDLAVVGAGLNPSTPAEALGVSPTATNELPDAPQAYSLDRCLTAWSHVSAERPDIYAAGLEQFVDGGCSVPATR
jgi:hypothetical protein